MASVDTPSVAPAGTEARKACYAALATGHFQSIGRALLDHKGYVALAIQNLIEGIGLESFEADFRQGDGNEMASKFLAAHSSAALAVNAFAPFKSDIGSLRLLGHGHFTHLHFERKCPHGLRRGNPPNLDVLVEGPNGVLAIESKCTEYLTPHNAEFRPAYSAEILDERRATTWFREMERLISNPRTYRWLNAAQLVKHAFGLGHTFRGQPSILLYLFWEPSNPGIYPIFAEHRSEIDRFAGAVEGANPRFIPMSYPELWASWDIRSSPDWLKVHVHRLRQRYGVAC